jgi:NitT/TauT family transport system substrate-binding protein
MNCGGEDMGIWLRLVCSAAAIWLILIGAAHAEPLRIFYFTWVGYGPLLVAQERGFFAEEEVAVELIHIADHTAAFAGLFAGQVDAVSAGTQDVLTFSEPDEARLVCVLPLDESRGSDGILAAKDIQSVADLKGRSVAVLRGSLQQFYLNVLLKEAGLSEADIEVVDLPFDDAAEAFMMQEVDAAVTYEPWLTPGKNVEHGHLLTDSSKQPGLLTDCLISRADVFDSRKAEFRAVGHAWAAAVDYAQAHPDEANEIMARYVGGGLEDPIAIAEALRGIRLYDAVGIREYLGTPDKPGPIYDTMRHAIDFMSSVGMLKVALTPADVIAHGILDE